VANKHYNKNTLEAVTQGQVSGEPASMLDPFRLAKTTIFAILICINNSFCDEVIDELHSAIDAFNKNPIISIPYSRAKPETAKEAEARCERENDEMRDVALNKAEVKDQRYWVNGEWVSTKYKPAYSASDLKDSDNDGYDDYTEFVNGTDPNNNRSFPIIRNGNNKKIFK
jgi:hypothetical protein